jgi:hypothetical protein
LAVIEQSWRMTAELAIPDEDDEDSRAGSEPLF